jgi:undecaprenyl-diphosphatase
MGDARVRATHATMSNVHAFDLINAGAGLAGWRLFLAVGLAAWGHWAAAAMLLAVWWRAGPASRFELLQMLLAVMLALCVGQVLGWWWPQPRPAALHLGQHYLATNGDSGWPSQHVTALWSLGLSALTSRRLALLGFPMLALGLAAAWCRIYLGANFPFDVLAAFPVALAGAVLAWALRRRLQRVGAIILYAYDRLERGLHLHRRPPRSG